MRAYRLGCLSSTGILAALIAVLSIAGYGFASGGVMFSPGPLNAVEGQLLGGVASHAQIDGDCQACHVAPWEAETMDDRCVVCHTNIRAGLSDPEDIHARLLNHDPTATCRECHPEHHGPLAPLTVLDRWKFPHEVTGYSLNGHPLKADQEPFQCGDCHGDDITVFDPEICWSCHNQMDTAFMVDHAITFGGSCLDCHDGLDTFGNDFDHNIFVFALNGKHAAVRCSQCHFGAHTMAELQATKQDCFSCHQPDDPHQGNLGTDCASCHSVEGWKPAHFDHNRSVFKLTGAHIEAACEGCHQDRIYKGTPQDCLSCHQKDEPHERRFGANCAECHSTTAWSPAKFDHNLSAFKLTGAHVNVACEACHVNKVYRGTAQDCFACHASDDQHQGQFGTVCSLCHETSSWKNVIFDHKDTAFPLQGRHANVQCAACHANGVFKGTPNNCFACHASDDKHQGQFGTDCAACHNVSGWQNVSFDHNNTAFPLRGSHASVQCQACHVNGVYKGTATDCYSCHASSDVHNGQFGTSCGSCHQPTRWQDVTFNHNNTAFPLTGRHAGVACQSCHANGRYKGTPTDCYSCHAAQDAHGGQFGANCGTCHNPSGWGNATFDHNNTAFPLIGKHSGLECQKCHGSGVYQGTPAQCVACHEDKHNGENGSDCAACHTPTDWGAAGETRRLLPFLMWMNVH